MAKRHPFKKTKPGEPIPVTARQLENYILEFQAITTNRHSTSSLYRPFTPKYVDFLDNTGVKKKNK